MTVEIILITDNLGGREVNALAEDLEAYDPQGLFAGLFCIDEFWGGYEERARHGLLGLDILNGARPPSRETLETAFGARFTPETTQWVWSDAKHCRPPLQVAAAADIMVDLILRAEPAAETSFLEIASLYEEVPDPLRISPEAEQALRPIVAEIFRALATLCRRLDARGAKLTTALTNQW